MKKKKAGTCHNCKWREGSRCRKLAEDVKLADWCGWWSEKKP